MEGIAITHKGIEDVAGREIKGIINKDSTSSPATLTFPIKNELELCELVYNARVLKSVLLKIDSFKLEDPEEVRKINPKVVQEWIPEGKTFAVRCRRIGDHVFSSKEVEQELGEHLFESIDRKVDLSNPDVTVLVYVIDDMCHVGIDFSGIDLSKREYRMFSYGETLKGTVAQAMNYIAEIKDSDTIIDPFSVSGLISIEATLNLTNKSVHFYSKDDFAFTHIPRLEKTDFDRFFEEQDKKVKEPKLNIYCSDFLQKNVRAAEKNAKIAGINKSINFSRMDIEWLDTKFEEGSVDKIVTFPPQMSKRTRPAQITKLLDEFFYVSNIILAEDGVIVMAFNGKELLDPILEKHKFKIDSTIDVWQGHECMQILIIKKV